MNKLNIIKCYINNSNTILFCKSEKIIFLIKLFIKVVHQNNIWQSY